MKTIIMTFVLLPVLASADVSKSKDFSPTYQLTLEGAKEIADRALAAQEN